MELVMDKWIHPYVDTSSWEFYDLSCQARDDTEDKVLHDAVEAGARIGGNQPPGEVDTDDARSCLL